MENDQYRVINGCIQILCHISLLNDVNIIEDYVQRGLINYISEFISCLDLFGKRIVINCLINLTNIGLINNIDYLQSDIFDNHDLMDLIESLQTSDNETLCELSKILYNSYSTYIDMTK